MCDSKMSRNISSSGRGVPTFASIREAAKRDRRITRSAAIRGHASSGGHFTPAKRTMPVLHLNVELKGTLPTTLVVMRIG